MKHTVRIDIIKQKEKFRAQCKPIHHHMCRTNERSYKQHEETF